MINFFKNIHAQEIIFCLESFPMSVYANSTNPTAINSNIHITDIGRNEVCIPHLSFASVANPDSSMGTTVWSKYALVGID